MRLSVLALLVVVAVLAAACGGQPPGVTEPPVSTVTTSVPPSSSTDTTRPGTTSAGGHGGAATASFSVAVGEGGVTYDLDGSPPSGPSSFVVLADGAVVIADTMAFRSGRPRLLRFDPSGDPLEPFDLSGAQVASIADVASDGECLAVLDIYAAQGRYRVLVLDRSGKVMRAHAIPPGFHLEDGLTGLVWDDSGLLLEIEWGARYARLTPDELFESTMTVVFAGTPVTITPGSGPTTVVEAGPVSFDVQRRTDLGGVTLIGRASDGSILLAVDEVGLDDSGAIQVTRRVQRHSATGELIAECVVGLEQFVEVGRSLEMTADGRVAQMVTMPDRVEIRILDV